jgi:transposase
VNKPMSDSRSFEVLTVSFVRLSSSPSRSYRSWSDEEKARIVGQTLVAGANVSAIARSNGLDPSQLFGTRVCLFAKTLEDAQYALRWDARILHRPARKRPEALGDARRTD